VNPSLDPDAQAILDVIRAAGTPPLHTLSVVEARAAMRATLISRGNTPALHSVEDVMIRGTRGGLNVRVYRPVIGRAPIALFLHGGGWTVNDLDTHDYLCRRLAERSGWVLASLDYRRAPEHPYPAALEDAYLGYRWLLDNSDRFAGDATSFALVGESAGGSLAAGLTLLARDRGAPMPTFQALAYPSLDRFDNWPSYSERGLGYALDRDMIKWFFDHYLPDNCDLDDPYLFPLRARDLSGLPPAFVMTAEFDPLRDEGLAYVDRLRHAGVRVEHLHAEDQMHGFLLLSSVVARAGRLIARLADALAAHHALRAS
jgi:acetyl esterase